MHRETFDQIHVEEFVIDNPEFLMEGLRMLKLWSHADTENVLSVELPQFVIMEVVYSEPGLRGDTATNTYKQAKVQQQDHCYGSSVC